MNFIISSLCDVARTLEMNAQGLQRFYYSVLNVGRIVLGGVAGGGRKFAGIMKSVIEWIN